MKETKQMPADMPAKNTKNKFTIFNIPILWFGVFSIIAIYAMYTENLPAGMIGALLITMVLGELFGWFGNNTPIVRTFLGGGAIVAIFGSAFMVYSGLMPESTSTAISEFMRDGDFLNFYIAALITGSILGMESKILVKAGVRYALPLLAAVLGAVGLAALIGLLLGFSVQEAVLVIAMPIMGGGMGAGAVPMSQVYSEMLGNEPGYYLSILVPALALGNVFAIILASVLNLIGNKYPSLTGNGQLIRGFHYEKKETPRYDLAKMGIGVLAAVSFYILGNLLGDFIPLHPYAIMIVLVAALKVGNVMPEVIVEGASQWYEFVARNWTNALLVGIGVAYTDLEAVINALSIQYVLIVLAVVIGAVIGAGVVGKFMGFYPIEAAITAGLCMANMGGTGDVAVLSAARRMELMPFAQISSRLGGALILLLASVFIPFFI
ncbi:2-hydroxycarboxylate transporter family protein [Planomicrobium sp. Y74]|uniref:2-hydroxycarboxylate transporter family protein n=1 Tax=Planomicrobium sp. Y74 TaxID=2478977 RepID=UPI00336BDC0D